MQAKGRTWSSEESAGSPDSLLIVSLSKPLTLAASVSSSVKWSLSLPSARLASPSCKRHMRQSSQKGLAWGRNHPGKMSAEAIRWLSGRHTQFWPPMESRM